MAARCKNVVHGQIHGFPVTSDPGDYLSVGLRSGIGIHQVAQITRQRLAERSGAVAQNRECHRIDVADLDNTRIRGPAHTCRSTGGGRSADVTRSGWTSCARAMQDAGVAAIKLNIYYIAGDPHVTGREV